jgi:hypothetical protein
MLCFSFFITFISPTLEISILLCTAQAGLELTILLPQIPSVVFITCTQHPNVHILMLIYLLSSSTHPNVSTLGARTPSYLTLAA